MGKIQSDAGQVLPAELPNTAHQFEEVNLIMVAGKLVQQDVSLTGATEGYPAAFAIANPARNELISVFAPCD